MHFFCLGQTRSEPIILLSRIYTKLTQTLSFMTFFGASLKNWSFLVFSKKSRYTPRILGDTQFRMHWSRSIDIRLRYHDLNMLRPPLTQSTEMIENRI